MSWKSQQGYTLGFFLNEPTVAVDNISSGVSTNVYTSPPLPVGTWIVMVNDIALTGDLTQALITVFADNDPVASCGILADVGQFPSLVCAVRSDGTVEVSIDIDCDTSVDEWSIGAGKVQLVKLTDTV
jgi:hypothetical protein